MEAQKGKSQGSRTADASIQVFVNLESVMRSGGSLWTCGRQGGRGGGREGWQ